MKNSTRILLLLGLGGLTLGSQFSSQAATTTKPTLVITSPKSGQRLSNDVFTATGTAKDNTVVTQVWYQLNGGEWTPANGTTNWTADLTLTPGTNTFRAYAVDDSANASKTNSVNFIYVATASMVVQKSGAGTVTPDLNGALLEIGRAYSLTAKPAKGFGFDTNIWRHLRVFVTTELVSDGMGGTTTNVSTVIIDVGWPPGAKQVFVMPALLVILSNATTTIIENFGLRANFLDIQKPNVVVTFPTVNKQTTNALLDISGKASDNVGMSSVWFQLNGAGWNLASTADGWSNWMATSLVPNIGGNVVQAYGADLAGNLSRTNSVKFIYVAHLSPDWAPDTLSGLIAQATTESEDPVSVLFDATTFSQAGADTNDDFAVGLYTYLKTGTNTAQLTVLNTAPPTATNDSIFEADLIFTNHYSGIISNDDGLGAISFSLATNLAPTTLAGKKVAVAGSHGPHTASLKSNGTFTLTPSISGVGSSSVGTYTYTRYSPNGGMLVLTFTGTDAGTVVYVQTTFTSAKGGSAFITTFDSLGNPTDLDLSTFTVK